jgi:hypothetical protein
MCGFQLFSTYWTIATLAGADVFLGALVAGLEHSARGGRAAPTNFHP